MPNRDLNVWRRLALSVLLTAAFLIAACPAAWAADPTFRAVSVVPDKEKRSTIQEVDGYAYLSEDMTLGQTRKAALVNAKRLAVEQAKTFINSKTTVEDFVITGDVIEGESYGSVTVLEQKDLGIEDNNRYHVWIRAEVEYGLKPPPPAAPSAGAPMPAGPLTVKVWTPKKHYADGERIEIFIQGNRDFYARIVDITSSGDIIQLLPNAHRRQSRFQGGQTYRIPDARDRFNLIVSPPYGEDQIVVYASDVPLGDVDLEPLGGGLEQFRGTRKEIGVKTRGIQVSPAGPGSGSGGGSPRMGAEFYEASWELTTGPR
jgi:hypothetical protein